MQYFKCKIRLGGSTMNEVQKIVSAPEALVLQYIHGMDALVDVTRCKTQKIDLREEKGRLKGLYDEALVKRETSIDNIFGALGRLPEDLPEDLLEQFGIYDDDDIDEDVKVDAITAAKNATKRKEHDPKNQTEQNNLDQVLSSEEVSIDDLAE